MELAKSRGRREADDDGTDVTAGAMPLRWLDNGATGCEVKADGDGVGGAANKPYDPRCRQGSAVNDDDDEDGDVRKCPDKLYNLSSLFLSFSFFFFF